MKIFKITLVFGSLGVIGLVLVIIYQIIKNFIPISGEDGPELSEYYTSLGITFFTLFLGGTCIISLLRQLQIINNDLKLYDRVRGFLSISQIVFGLWITGWSTFALIDLLSSDNLTENDQEYSLLIMVCVLLTCFILLGLGLVIDFFLGKKISKKRLYKIDTTTFGLEMKES